LYYPIRKSFYHGPCSEKDDRLLYEKRYKIIVGSATDRRDFMLYCTHMHMQRHEAYMKRSFQKDVLDAIAKNKDVLLTIPNIMNDAPASRSK